MSQLALYSLFNLKEPHQVSEDVDVLASQLGEDGILFKRLPVVSTLPNAQLSSDEILMLNQEQVEKIKHEYSYQCADVASIKKNDRFSMLIRSRYLSEHTHSEDEARFFLSGSVLLYIHINERIHMLNCTKGDLVIIPSGVKHWLDVGPNPNFTCIRCYNKYEGLSNLLTGSYIAEATPRWETIFNIDQSNH